MAERTDHPDAVTAARRKDGRRRRIGREPNLVPPVEILLRYHARVLDPLSVLTLKGQLLLPTVYVSNRLLVRNVATVLPTLTRVAGEYGLRPVVYERDADLAKRLGEAPVAVRVLLVAEGDHPHEAPDAWRVLQSFRAEVQRSGDSGTSGDVSLDHLLTACTSIEGVPFVGGHGVGGVPFVGGHGVGSASAQYGVPGAGGRTPVTWVGPRPHRHREFSGRRPVVAVLDTAIGDHPWLIDEVVDRKPEVDGELIGSAAAGDDGMSVDPLEGVLDDDAGHGTFIAGLIHQLCPDARILGVQVMPTSGAVPEGDLLHALWQLVRRQQVGQDGRPDQLIDVVSLSLGYYHEQPQDASFDSKLLDALLALAGLGVAVVASAGNGSTDRLMYPAAFTPYDGGAVGLERDRVPLVSVGALNPNRTVALFSNAGPWVKCYRPGAALVSTMPVHLDGGSQAAYDLTVPGYGRRANIDPDNFYGGFASWSGTSFAAPVLAGQLAATMLSHRGELPLEDAAVPACLNRGWHAVSKQTDVERPQ